MVLPGVIGCSRSFIITQCLGSFMAPQNQPKPLPSLTAPACWHLWMAGSLTTILLMKQMSAMSDLEVVLPTLTVIASPGQLSAPNMVPLLRSWQLILAFPSSLESGGFLQCRASSQCKWYLLKPSGLHFSQTCWFLPSTKKYLTRSGLYKDGRREKATVLIVAMGGSGTSVFSTQTHKWWIPVDSNCASRAQLI